MQFLIRADASLQIGSGHIMRCLTLAHKLRQHHHRVAFITRAHQGHLADTIRQQGFDCILLPLPDHATTSAQPQRQPETACNELPPSPPAPAIPHAAWLATSQAQDITDCAPHIRALAPDWIICDHYALAAAWQTAACALCHSKIMVIDDLHDRAHDADLLLDQNHAHTAADYAPLVPPSCRILTGTRYALLRDEFAQHRTISLHQRATPPARQPETALPHSQNILINLGGVDKDNHTLAVLQALSAYVSGSLKALPIRATIIMGATAPHLARIQHYAATAPYPSQVIANAPNMAELMTQATWAIGAAGSSSWERCALGLPTLLITIADNQRPIAAQLQSAGAAIALEASQIPSPAFQTAIAHLMQPENQQRISQAAVQLCDAHGAERVAQHIAQLAPLRAHPRMAQPPQHPRHDVSPRPHPPVPTPSMVRRPTRQPQLQNVRLHTRRHAPRLRQPGTHRPNRIRMGLLSRPRLPTRQRQRNVQPTAATRLWRTGRNHRPRASPAPQRCQHRPTPQTRFQAA